MTQPPGPARHAPRLGGRYRLDERIGAGGMGEVWRATDEVLGRTVAVKLILPALMNESGFAHRFLAEAQAMASVSHPGVVAIHDYHSGADGAFLVMDFVEGEALSQTLGRVGRLTPEVTMDLVAQAATALHAIHARGIVHRDVKPANLMLRPDGRVLITDFGIARTATGAALTTPGAVLGTPSYLAPEQVLGEPATPRSDVYSLGLVAYECLAGRRPFEGENPLAVALRRVQETPQTLAGDTPPAVVALVERSLATDPAHRWATAADMANAARAALRSGVSGGGRSGPGLASHQRPGYGLAPDRRRSPRTSKGPRLAWSRRHTLVAILAVVVAVLAGAGVWFFADIGPGARPDAPPEFVACGQDYCPPTPTCWGGLVVISGVVSRPRHLDCGELHYWQTFVGAYLPEGAVGVPQDELMAREDVAGICSATTLARHSRDPAQTTAWRREPLPLQRADGTWILHCLAGPDTGEWTGSLT